MIVTHSIDYRYVVNTIYAHSIYSTLQGEIIQFQLGNALKNRRQRKELSKVQSLDRYRGRGLSRAFPFPFLWPGGTSYTAPHPPPPTPENIRAWTCTCKIYLIESIFWCVKKRSCILHLFCSQWAVADTGGRAPGARAPPPPPPFNKHTSFTWCTLVLFYRFSVARVWTFKSVYVLLRDRFVMNCARQSSIMRFVAKRSFSNSYT